MKESLRVSAKLCVSLFFLVTALRVVRIRVLCVTVLKKGVIVRLLV
jgi:hypothetical protein